MKELYINKNEKKMEKTINELIVDAMGNRTIKQFAKDCGLDTILLQQILRNTKLITPDILKKIANNAQNDISYGKLMNSAGFLNFKELNTMTTFRENDTIQQHPMAIYDGLNEYSQEFIDQVRDYFLMIQERNNNKTEEE